MEETNLNLSEKMSLNSETDLLSNPEQVKRILEAVLLSAQQALSVNELKKVFADSVGADVLRVLLDELR